MVCWVRQLAGIGFVKSALPVCVWFLNIVEFFSVSRLGHKIPVIFVFFPCMISILQVRAHDTYCLCD